MVQYISSRRCAVSFRYIAAHFRGRSGSFLCRFISVPFLSVPVLSNAPSSCYTEVCGSCCEIKGWRMWTFHLLNLSTAVHMYDIPFISLPSFHRPLVYYELTNSHLTAPVPHGHGWVRFPCKAIFSVFLFAAAEWSFLYKLSSAVHI